MTRLDALMSTDEVDLLMDEFDRDGDGSVCLDEFKSPRRPRPATSEHD